MTIFFSALLACDTAQRPLLVDEAPNIVLVFVQGVAPEAPEGVERTIGLSAAVDDPTKGVDAALASAFEPSGESNTLPKVLNLYGYTSAADFPTESATRLGFQASQSQDWVASAAEPFLWVSATRDGAATETYAAVEQDLRAAGRLDRTLVAFVWTDGWDKPAPSWWRGPGTPPPLADGAVASTLDITPTLLATGKATVPSDASGASLATVTGGRRVAFGHGSGTFVVQSSEARLSVEGPDPIPRTMPVGAVYTDSTGSRPAEGAQAEDLYSALLGWRIRENAVGARSRMGAEQFDTLNAEAGYWR